MNLFRAFLLTVMLAVTAGAAGPDVVKVLPHYLDLEGRHARSPSLFERDNYQEFLRNNPAQRSGLRFDIQCSGIRRNADPVVMLRLEIRGAKTGAAKPLIIDEAVKPGGLAGTWVAIKLNRDQLQQLGDVAAWRASLWQGQDRIAELKSFMW